MNKQPICRWRFTETDTLAMALDPGRIMRAQGMTPDPWQQDLLLSDDNQILLNCSRQAGKSQTTAALAIHKAIFQPGSLTLLLCPSLRQSGELFRKVTQAYNAIGRPLGALADAATKIELSNGSRIVCLPGKEETIRSFSAVSLLVLDEAARIPDDLYRSVRPMLAVSHGRLLCLSTPFGQRGFFWDEWSDGGKGWKRIESPWQNCPRITPTFIDSERRAMGTSWVKQEYECSFESLEGIVYPDFEKNVGVDMAPPYVPKIGGIDFGFRNPFAALWGHLDCDDVLWILGERYERERSIFEHAEHLPKGILWYADPAGAQETDILRKLDFAVKRGGNDIAPGIATVRSRIETRRLKILWYKCPNLMAEAKLYRYPTKKDGRAESETPVDDNNHALGALRYMISRLDHKFYNAWRRKNNPAKIQTEGELDLDPTEAADSIYTAHKSKPWLRIDNPALWKPC